MRDSVKQAIQAAYVDSQGHADPDYRLISKQQAEIIAQEMRIRCQADVKLTDDTNYSNSYYLVIKSAGLSSKLGASNPSQDQAPASRSFTLYVRISWLGPFAMKFWNVHEKGKDPLYLDKPETPRDKELEACVIDLLHHHSIDILSEEELKEPVPFVKITLLDYAAVNVRHLLFAEYL